MPPTIRIDNEVMGHLKEVAKENDLIFSTPNQVLRKLLGLDSPVNDAAKFDQGGRENRIVSSLGQRSAVLGSVLELKLGVSMYSPLQQLRGYIAREGGARQYDSTPIPDDDHLTETQIFIINKLGGRGVPEHAVQEIIRRETRVRKALQRIPRDASLLSENQPIRELTELFDVLLRPPIKYLSVSRATKILHRYRPHLIPILDNKLFEFYYQPTAVLSGEIISTLPTQKALDCLKILKVDADANREVLENLATETGLTPLRVFDVLLWLNFPVKNS